MADEKKRQVSEAWREAAYIAAAFLVAALGWLVWRLIFYRADFAAAAKEVRASYRQGDAVAIFPSWMREEVFTFEGMAVIAPKEETYVNFHGFRRLWAVINTKYAPGRFPLKNSVRPVSESMKGKVSIQLYDLPPYNATAVMKDANVFTGEGAERKPCKREGDLKWICGDQHWQFVGPHKVEVSGHQAECIWAHPMAGRPIEIELPASAAYSAFHIYTAFTDSGAGGGPVPPVKLEILQDGRLIREVVTHQRGGWNRHDVRFNSESGRPLTARVTTAQEGRQHWCFNIEAE